MGDTRPKVIVVEDDASFRRALVRSLSVAGFAVSAFESAEALLQALEDGADCLLLDVRLPGTSGPALLRALRNQNVQTPAILMTSEEDELDQRKAFDLGAAAYLVKPFRRATLLAKVEEVMERTAWRSEPGGAE